MKSPVVAVVSFPGNNCEVESLRSLKQAGITPLYFRWNDDREKLAEVDGYFIPGGFSYEDRGRSGMVAGRDSLMEFIAREAEQGKAVIGNCNGAQILVESGLIPLDKGLRMSLARNVVEENGSPVATGFLSEWVWITPASGADRCCTSDWQGTMHVPIAHGEGRFTTRDQDVVSELKKNKQIAFSYCDAEGKVSSDASVTPNGSMYAIAGLCNPVGNVVALMPHPERTANGAPYFASLKKWIATRQKQAMPPVVRLDDQHWTLPEKKRSGTEIFIDTIIVNNEERTVEQTARMYAPNLRLRQWRYVMLPNGDPSRLLSSLSFLNANKERAYVRRGNTVTRWNAEKKAEEPLAKDQATTLLDGALLLRRDLPDTASAGLGEGAETGVCYLCTDVPEEALSSRRLLEVFANPHASDLRRLR